MGAYIFLACSRIHPRNHLNLPPPLGGLGGLEVGDFQCVEFPAAQLPLTIGNVPEMSINLSVAMHKSFLACLDKSLKLSRHPRGVVHVKLDGL